MFKKIFLIFFLIAISYNTYSGVIVLQGKYQSKNLYIISGATETGVGYCTYDVYINNERAFDEINTKTFEVDFSALLIKYGTDVLVEIVYKNNCLPKVLNPEVLTPESTFEMVNISFTNDNNEVSWTTINEANKLPFIVEQFKWNRWVKVGEISGKAAKKGLNKYSFTFVHTSGVNMIRVKQIGFSGVERVSESVKFESSKKSISYRKSRDNTKIVLSRITMFEIYDSNGRIKKFGYGKEVSIANLHKGKYILNFDNKSKDIIID